MRISRIKGIFEHGFLPNWTEQIYKIHEINKSTPVTYAFVSPVSRIFHHYGIGYHQYADDTQLYTEIDPRVGICPDDLTRCVESVNHWFLLNGLQLNANKTEAIVFGTRQQLDHCQQYSSVKICGTDVKISPCIKTLGVHLDAALSMDVQVSETVKICNYHIRSLRHVRKCLTLDSAKTIACGLVAARLDYCNSLLSGTSKSNIMKLQRVQNDLARVVLQRRWGSPSAPMLTELHWLPIVQRIDYKVALITFKTLSSDRPAYLRELISKYEPTRVLRSLDQELLLTPFRRTSSAMRAFSHAAPVTWNKLPLFIRKSTTVETYKKLLKTELFRTAFSNC